MAERLFIFRDGPVELVLPVTPDSYTVNTGINIELVNIHELGDVILLGYGTLSTIKINCMFPANDYAFARDSDPEYYVEQFKQWVPNLTKDATPTILRFVVSGTGVNIPVAVEDIQHGEQDGSNDVYATIILREYRDLEAEQVEQTCTGNKSRPAMTRNDGETASSYVIQAGDTLSAICRKFYGSCLPEVYNKLAGINGIANPHLIVAGTVLQLPQSLE